MSDELLSVREFARRDGCDPKRVRRGLERGELPTRADRLLPASMAGTAWRVGNRCPDAEGAPPPKAKRSRFKAKDAPISLTEAQRRREVALAGLKRHELATKSGEWISRDELEWVWQELLAAIRARLFMVPGTAAPRVAACVRAGEVQGVLQDVIYAALTELSEHRFSVPMDEVGPELELPDASTKLEAETAKVTAQGRLRQLEMEIVEGRRVSLEEAEDAIGKALMTARQRMLNIVGFMPPRLKGLDVDQVEAALLREVLGAIKELDGAKVTSGPADGARRRRKNAR